MEDFLIYSGSILAGYLLSMNKEKEAINPQIQNHVSTSDIQETQKFISNNMLEDFNYDGSVLIVDPNEGIIFNPNKLSSKNYTTKLNNLKKELIDFLAKEEKDRKLHEILFSDKDNFKENRDFVLNKENRNIPRIDVEDDVYS